MSKDVIEKAERIHLGVASGTRSKALLWHNIIHSPVTARHLISVGQLKAMLDLRLVWDDGPPMLLFCSSAIKYVLIRARVFHGLPIVSEEELKALIAAIEDFTVTGKLWSYADWLDALGRDFEIFGDSMRRDHPQTIEEEGRMRLSILPVRDMMCSAFPVKGQICKIFPKRAWQLHARLRSRMRSAMPGRVRRSMFASILLRLRSMQPTKALRALLHLMLLLLPEKGH